ncbi:hypothetical protein ACP4OV_023107 [Aristida adscensionis]
MGAFAGLLAGKLGALVVNEATLLWSFRNDLEGLKETMELLHAMMHDADRRSGQGQGQSVGVWMKRFRAAAFDVEDLLDKFEAVELIKQIQPKIKLVFSSYNPLLIRLTMAHKMKKVKKDLDIIKEDGQRLNLVPNYSTPRSAEGITDQATVATSEDIAIRMVGRDNEKEKIMKLLLEREAEQCVSIIPIVGLGGLGKTTLAKAVFSDKRAKIFDLRVWVYVSKTFNLTRIGEIIISSASRSIGSGPSEGYIIHRNGDLNSIIEQVNTILYTKRYLIVLDDMWEEGVDNLEKLKQMLQYGGKGSRIILTTRMQHVVEKLDVDDILVMQKRICPVHESDRINLRFLSVDECWNVMRQRALGQDVGVGRFEKIGIEIARKCGGLPLLARSLGFLLSQDKSTEAWEEIRDRNITLDLTEDDQASETLERLMLSYYYMPFKVKLCFTYCAVFPKGFVVARDHLIQQWRALGYIQSIIDDLHCINYLLGMSFLQISESSSSTPMHAETPVQVTMHDLVHDLARIIAGSELIVSDASEKINWSRTEKNYGRHMQLVNSQKQSEALKEFPGKIRSLHFTECGGLQIRQNSLSKSKYLRVLDLSGYCTEADPASSNILLPSYSPQLILLRYLDASGLTISALPKSLHKLQNMQTLILSNCTLETLPDDIGSLLNLGYFDLSGNSSLNKLPASFGKLSALSFLKLSGCSELEDLPESFPKLKCLRHLDMSGCCALQKLPDMFGSLPKLLFLNLSGCSELVKLPDIFNLESLEHLNLSSCHELQNLPPDFGNLHKLKFFSLSDCYKVQVLPESFCQLRHLKYLDLSDCHDIRELPACFGNLSELRSLNLTSCSKLQSFPKSFSDLSKLKHFNLSYCVRIKKLPSSFGKLMLQELDISGCTDLITLPDIPNVTSLTQLRTNAWNKPPVRKASKFITKHLKLPDSKIHHVHQMDNGECSIMELGKSICRDLTVEYLKDINCPEDAERAKLCDYLELRRLTLKCEEHGTFSQMKTGAEKVQLVLEKLVPPRTLEEFALSHYRNKDFPNWMLDISSYLPYLVSIGLWHLTACDSLPPFGQLPNLRLLHLVRLPGIRKIGKEFYGEEGTCKKLRVIRLRSLENVDEWWTTRSGDVDEEFLIPNLHHLQVHDCPKLKFLPHPPKSMHWDLHDSDEVLPERGFGRLSSSTVPFQASIISRHFSPDKWARLRHLAPTLEILDVNSNNNSFRTLPEVTPCFPSLRILYLSLKALEVLPEWLGQLISLEELRIRLSPKLRSLPESLPNLTALKTLEIWKCPILIERCRGEDAHKISHIPERLIMWHRRQDSHIPEVIFDNRRFTQGQPSEGSELTRTRLPEWTRARLVDWIRTSRAERFRVS